MRIPDKDKKKIILNSSDLALGWMKEVGYGKFGSVAYPKNNNIGKGIMKILSEQLDSV